MPGESITCGNIELYEQVQKRAQTDSMTNLLNHHTFYNMLDKEVHRSGRYGNSLSLIMVDLDGLKQLNDTYGLEKIKTIGDAYMAVAGIPEPVADHAERSIRMAVDMLRVLKEYSMSRKPVIKARIGICSGPVVAGVIGRHKFIYDLWGDTVNTASRMESHGIPEEIQVTESTYLLLKDKYEFEERGEIEIKGKGKLLTYLLKNKD